MNNKSENNKIHKKSYVLQTTIQPVIATIVKPDKLGEIRVKYGSNVSVPARLLENVNRKKLMQQDSINREVLVVFENGDHERPIIIGIMENIIEDVISTTNLPDSEETTKDKSIEKIISLNATDNIKLKCGENSICLDKEKIIINGIDIVSNASNINKVKGGAVKLN